MTQLLQCQLFMKTYESCSKQIQLEIADHAYDFYQLFNLKNHCYDDSQLTELQQFHDDQQLIKHDNSCGGEAFVLTDQCLTEKLVGLIRFNSNFAYITHLYVCPEYRGQGMSRILLGYAENVIRSKGHKKVDIIVYDEGKNTLLKNDYVITKSSYSQGDGIQHTAYKMLTNS